MSQNASYDIPRRLRRLRRTPASRALVQETHVSVDDFIMPLFVKEGDGDAEPVDSMPGQFRTRSQAWWKSVARLPGSASGPWPCSP